MSQMCQFRKSVHLHLSTDMALRLGKFFGNGAELWAGLQTDYDLWEARQKLADELARIKTLPKSA